MGAKYLYLDNRKKYRIQIRLDNDLKAISKLENGFKRFDKYGKTWEVYDLDEIVNQLFNDPVYINNGQKFTITSQESDYIIYCDNSGSYFRIGKKDIPVSQQGHYLTINLKSPLNEIINGKISGVKKERREQLTHFRMKIKKEM